MRFLKNIAALVLIGAMGSNVMADIPVTEDGNLSIYGDVRLRWEQDFDSKKANGAERFDRDRIRYRARIGLKYNFLEQMMLNVRLRTGDNNSQQSPHVTLWQDEGDKGDQSDVNVDRLFVKWTINDKSSLTVGRNGLAIWKPNELLWDDDVYIDGASFTHALGTESGDFTFNAALALLPDGAESHSIDERSLVGAGQIVFKKTFEEDKLTLAEALIFISDNNDTFNPTNDDEDFLISYTNAQYIFAADSAWPVSIGADLMFNFNEGPAKDHPSDQLGFDVYVSLGRFKKKNDWVVGYTFARIEKWAVPRYLAQDDYLRWGSATQTRSSDFFGHEFRLGYKITDKLNVLARYYLTDSINTIEDGRRFRIDFNFKF